MTAHGTPTRYTDGCRCMECTTAAMAHRRRGLPPGDSRHGLNGYTNFGCRCQPCRAEALAAWRKRQAQRLAQGLAPGDPRHGTSNGYSNYGCRCDECRTAYTRDHRTTRQRSRQRANADLWVTR